MAYRSRQFTAEERHDIRQLTRLLQNHRANPAYDRSIRCDAEVSDARRRCRRAAGADGSIITDEVDAARAGSRSLREIRNSMSPGVRVFLATLLIVISTAGCSPDRAMDFGPVGEISS